jgi:hypothetical protein
MKKILSFIHLVLCFNLLAAETDQFTNRDQVLNDSSEFINSRANAIVKNSLEVLNNRNHGCNEEELYSELRIYFGNHSNGELTKEIIKSKNIDRRSIKIADSVFREWTPWDGFGMGFDFLKKSEITLTSSLRIGDSTIGTDKFEHFFGQGYFYFLQNYIKGKGNEKALKTGIFKEKVFLGGNKFGNGVFSYGDLAANFNGMRFWNHILLKQDDILGKNENIGPYVTCEQGQWMQTEKIDFRKYFDDSMDESINCSKFPSQNTADKVKKAVAELGLKCPVDQSRYDGLKNKYKELSNWILNDEGLAKVKYFNEF